MTEGKWVVTLPLEDSLVCLVAVLATTRAKAVFRAARMLSRSNPAYRAGDFLKRRDVIARRLPYSRDGKRISLSYWYFLDTERLLHSKKGV